MSRATARALVAGAAVALSLALSLAPAPARAQDAPTLVLAITDCEFAAFDRAELTSRLALELDLPPTAITLAPAPSPPAPPPATPPPAPATLFISIDAPCAAHEVALVAARDDRELARTTADLGDTTGRPRVWALALLVAELVRSANAPPAPTPAPARPRASRRARSRQALDDERPWSARESASRSAFALGLDGTVHLEQLTLAPTLRAAFSHETLHLALGVFAMSVGSSLGSITYGGAGVRFGGRFPLTTGSVGNLGAGAAVGGALVYASGHDAAPGVAPADSFGATAGGTLSMWAEWPLAGALALDAELSVGYDVIGPTLEAGGEPLVSFRGLRLGLALALAAPL